MEVSIQVARRLPDELQEYIWKIYNNNYVLPCLMNQVEQVLYNKEYESLFEECSTLINNCIDKLLRFKNSYILAFDISIDVAFDRLFECNVPDVDKIGLLNIIKDYINNPHLLKITLENTEMHDAYGCSKSTQLYVLMEKLEDVYRIIMPFGDDYLNLEEIV